MVFFSCYACGDSMRKNAVEKHRMRCRRSSTFSCLDCGVDFPGDSYQMHMKCVSEQQKYSGGTYQDSQSKGELKQEQWIARLRKTLQNTEPSNTRLRNVLENLISYGNVPRKQNKFKNFMKTSLRVLNDKLIDDAWAAISAAPEEDNGANDNDSHNGSAVTATNGNGLKREMEDEEPDGQQPPEKKVKKAELLSVAEEAQDGVQEMTKQLKKKCRSAVKKALRESAEERVKVKVVQKAVLPTLQNEGVTKEMLRSYIKSLETHKKFILDGKYISLRKKM